MPFFPMAATAQVGTVGLLQHRRIVPESVQGNHKNVVVAYDLVHVRHRANLLKLLHPLQLLPLQLSPLLPLQPQPPVPSK
ncbi:hypothetical protein D3C75_1339900 [compost metagenome]